LNIFSAENFEILHSLPLEGRIWDIGFIKHLQNNADGGMDLSCGIAVACGDYKAIFYDTNAMQPTLEVIRPRTVRCLNYHPNLPLLATGDGSGLVAIVDYLAEDTIAEFEVGGRVNVLEFSPKGDYLLIGTDGCHFTLHETMVSDISNKSLQGGANQTSPLTICARLSKLCKPLNGPALPWQLLSRLRVSG
jgi:WD40 repeat protein